MLARCRVALPLRQSHALGYVVLRQPVPGTGGLLALICVSVLLDTHAQPCVEDVNHSRVQRLVEPETRFIYVGICMRRKQSPNRSRTGRGSQRPRGWTRYKGPTQARGRNRVWSHRADIGIGMGNLVGISKVDEPLAVTPPPTLAIPRVNKAVAETMAERGSPPPS